MRLCFMMFTQVCVLEWAWVLFNAYSTHERRAFRRLRAIWTTHGRYKYHSHGYPVFFASFPAIYSSQKTHTLTSFDSFLATENVCWLCGVEEVTHVWQHLHSSLSDIDKSTDSRIFYFHNMNG
jgi:hypothetical protein